MDPIRVLILEDDEDIVDLIGSILGGGYEIVAAGNGQEGLQTAEEWEPDLVICDIMMPVMDGWEFTRRLHERQESARTPVIYLSALSAQECIRKGYETGGALYLTKPIEPARLKRNIELFIDDRGIVPRPKRRRIDQVRPATRTEHRFEPHHTPPPRAEQRPRPAPPPSPAPPRAEPPPAPPPKAAAKPTRPAAPPPPRARVLVVDDDKDTCLLLQAGLAGEFEVVMAHDGMSAVERAIHYKPDIFVIDCILPRMTGYQVTMMLKKNRDFYKAPIVFVSGKASERDQQYARSLGVTHFFAKPFSVSKVVEVLRQIARAPGFSPNRERPELPQQEVQADQLHHFEMFRPAATETPTLKEIEEMAVENKLRQQLS